MNRAKVNNILDELNWTKQSSDEIERTKKNYEIKRKFKRATTWTQTAHDFRRSLQQNAHIIIEQIMPSLIATHYLWFIWRIFHIEITITIIIITIHFFFMWKFSKMTASEFKKTCDLQMKKSQFSNQLEPQKSYFIWKVNGVQIHTFWLQFSIDSEQFMQMSSLHVEVYDKRDWKETVTISWLKKIRLRLG